MEDRDYELRPSRGWWKRAAILNPIPKEVREIYSMVKEKFGADVANLILILNREYGSGTANRVGRKMIEFKDFEELVAYLSKKADMFEPRSRRFLSAIITMYRYNKYFVELQEEIEKTGRTGCPELPDVARAIFHTLASKGLFYSPSCIVAYVKATVCDSGEIPKRCASTVEAIEAYGEPEEALEKVRNRRG